MTTNFAIYPCALGYVKIAHKNSRLKELQILENQTEDLGKADPYTDEVFRQLSDYLSGQRNSFDLELDLSSCTEFQRAVLSELQKIPYAQTFTYKQVAIAIGKPKASRAVGQANNRNPIHIIIPCHRVIGSGGKLTGYAAGIENKDFLLRLERAYKARY